MSTVETRRGRSNREYHESLHFQRLRWRRSFFKPGYTIATNALHPKSRGRISLNSRDINDQPKIEPNYFSHPDDVRTIVASAQLALRLGLSPPFRRRGARVFDTPSPHCKHLRLFSDAYFACIIREVGRLVKHCIGMFPPMYCYEQKEGDTLGIWIIKCSYSCRGGIQWPPK